MRLFSLTEQTQALEVIEFCFGMAVTGGVFVPLGHHFKFCAVNIALLIHAPIVLGGKPLMLFRK
jgi:hypothetical protein